MKLVDVHCHINHERCLPAIKPILNQAKMVGLQAILLSGVNPANNRQVLALCEKYPLLKASLGIYPIDALGLAPDETGLPEHKGPINLEAEFAFFAEHADKIVAIGEVGMDFKWASKDETGAQQEQNFVKIIQCANRLKKPLVIHSRNAEQECLDVLEAHADVPVDLHCFSGKKSLVKRAVGLGYYLSIPPNVVNSSHFQMVVGLVPMEQLLTETDSPWLGPDKDEVNEPANVVLTVQKIAEIKGLDVSKVVEQIWENYQRFISC